MRLLLAILLLTLLPLLSAERQTPMVRLWQSEDGLPGNVVRSIVQSADGYLWVATAEGIACFDGVEFDTIEPDGELRRFRFAFWRLFAPEDGSVWVTTFQGGLFRIQDGRLERVVHEAPRPRPPLINQLILDRSGIIHFRRGEEIWKLEKGTTVLVEAPSDELKELFARDHEKQTAGGRAVETGTGWKVSELHTKDGRRWAPDETGRLVIDGEVPVDLPGVASPYVFNELLEDREGNVWVATPVSGLARVRRSRVEPLSISEGPSQPTTFAIMQDRAGTWWIANRRGGVDRWSGDQLEHLNLVTTGYQRPVSTMFEDRDGVLWVASRGGSVFSRREDGTFMQRFGRTQIPSKVRTIQQDGDGVVWFGGEQGLASYDGTAVKEHREDCGLPKCDVTVLVRNGKDLVAATSDGRVFTGGSKGFRMVGDPAPLKHWWISGLLPVASDELWATTLGGGLFLWNGKAWRQFAADDGVPDLRLTCILNDDRGQLWFGSLGGILRASRQELLDRARKQERPLHWLRLDRSDGLPSRECIGGYHPAGWKGHDGRLWFPTGSGVVRVRPDLVEVNKVQPPVYLRSTRINGVQQEEHEGKIEAGPGRSRVEFRFVGLSYSAPEKVTYRARLEGLDDSWRELGSQRVAAYEAVPPGRYTFEVLAVNGDGVWSKQAARVSIHIKPHFWESAWFLLSVAALTIAGTATIAWYVARRRMKQRIQALKIRNARESERTRIARDLHDDLGASLTEISILSALAAEGGDESAMRPALDQLSNKAKAVVGTLDEIVWAVNPREDTLRSLVDYLAAFAREFLDTASIALRTDIPRNVPETPLDATVRHGVFLAAREALNNLVKHSKATQARLAVQLDDSNLEIRIEDNGRGFSQEWEAKGYGVANLRERMKAAGGDCSIASVSGQGVTVILTLPLLAAPSSPT
ncbi:histidine kinase [Luteolibacter arcticus]|uniref:Oxygen sensor histidine kinase NreB n=1 Tax=Luteolibacter arcticus TaxID=1581411 RepID=A0ABT3GDY4_9BACT|nr:two-component regulator propeller domain-containing protein [Luteolibacter arcticus]MCW1921483.1 histidine kinase [Luteolibacter arcticus]